MPRSAAVGKRPAPPLVGGGRVGAVTTASLKNHYVPAEKERERKEEEGEGTKEETEGEAVVDAKEEKRKKGKDETKKKKKAPKESGKKKEETSKRKGKHHNSKGDDRRVNPAPKKERKQETEMIAGKRRAKKKEVTRVRCSLIQVAPLTYVLAHINGRIAKLLIDSGAQINCMSSTFAKYARLRRRKKGPYVDLILANKTVERSNETIGPIKCHAGDFSFVEEFQVMVTEHNGVLGKPWLQKYNPDIDWRANKVTVEMNGEKHELPTVQTEAPKDEFLTFEELEAELAKGKQLMVISVKPEEKTIEQRSDDQEMAKQILAEYDDVFKEELPAGLPPSDRLQHVIELEEGAKPHCEPLRPMSPGELKETREKLDEYLAKGWIRPSDSPYGSQVLFAVKGDKSLRFCVDYRGLNKITKKSKYPLPRFDEILDRIGKSRWFSKIDLASGYHQIAIRPEDIQKTAFRTRYGSYEFQVMPFGLTNAPATFQRLMNHVLHGIQDVCAAGILDDILVFSPGSAEEHAACLRKVLDRLREHQLIAKIKKCELFRKETEFWGHTVTERGWQTSEEKIKTVKEWPLPLPDISAVRSFLGLCSYYRRFVKDFAKIAAPLHDLLKKDQEFTWEEKHTEAANELKKRLISAPVLKSADLSQPFILRTDASDYAIGAVLAQKDKEGKEHPVAYESRKLRPTERRWTHEKELLAIVHAFKVWRRYLQGSKTHVFTDHQTLQYLNKQKQLTPLQVDWMSTLSQFDYDIHYIPGKNNAAADACSRRPDLKGEINVIEVLVPTPMRQYLKEAAKQDTTYQESVERLRKGEAMVDGKRAILDEGLILLEINENLLVLVPEGAQEEVVKQHHEPPFAGHFGAEKTTENIRRQYWWKGLGEKVKTYVSECRVCQGTKHETGKSKGLLQPIEPAQAPWETVSIDFITGLPVTHDGEDALMVVIDQFSKMVHYIPVKETITAEETAQRFLEGVVRLHGIPKKIISDRDVKFTSRMWTELWRSLGTQLAMSSAYHPQTDGATERANRVVLQMLRAYAAQNPNDWSKRLALLEFATNNAEQKATGYSPFFVCSGRHPRTTNTIGTSPLTRQQKMRRTGKRKQQKHRRW